MTADVIVPLLVRGPDWTADRFRAVRASAWSAATPCSTDGVRDRGFGPAVGAGGSPSDELVAFLGRQP